jgi:hypothetical protein
MFSVVLGLYTGTSTSRVQSALEIYVPTFRIYQY